MVAPDILGETHIVRLFRSCTDDRWNVEFFVTKLDGGGDKAVLSVASNDPDPFDDILQTGDVVISINGMEIGSPLMDTLQKVITRLSQEVDAMMEIQRPLS